ncbi:hypothetical protein HWV62_22425 [Athelia sp. TMB]|nr:hypothetical protein HWV62_22425 [Athelia sp. TMB]
MSMLYSPFFTSGLLSARDDRDELGPRRGSLPTDVYSPTSSTASASSEDSADFYRTLQPRRDPTQLRSFLSLDLAESQSTRSASIKRRAPAQISTFLAAPPTTQLRRASRSRDSLRSIPSPKPVPSASLPAIPSASTPSSPARSAAPVLPPIPSTRLSFASALASFRLPSPKKSAALKRASTPARTISIASTERRARREDALAALEGRGHSSSRRPQTSPASAFGARPHTLAPSTHTRARNFMDMSDEEDGCFDPSPLPTSPTSFVSPAPLPLPPLSPTSFVSPPPAPATKGRRRGTLDSWFLPAPLASFIDLADDDAGAGWGWRVEVRG